MSWIFNPTHRVSVNVLNVYSKSAFSSTIVTQLVIGEPVQTIMDGPNGLAKIKAPDGSLGWVVKNRLKSVDKLPELPESIILHHRSTTVFSAANPHSRIVTVLPLGARVCQGKRGERTSGERVYRKVVLPDWNDGWVAANSLTLLSERPPTIHYKQTLSSPVPQDLPRRAASHAKRLIGCHYLEGGSTPCGLDTDGMTQLCYKLAGFQLPRSAYEQMDVPSFDWIPSSVLYEAQLEAGDLLFFGSSHENIGLVGIAVSPKEFILASGDNYGGGTYRVAIAQSNKFEGLYQGARRLKTVEN
jgi:cell wall-associated NlpC family hydrolase